MNPAMAEVLNRVSNQGGALSGLYGEEAQAKAQQKAQGDLMNTISNQGITLLKDQLGPEGATLALQGGAMAYKFGKNIRQQLARDPRSKADPIQEDEYGLPTTERNVGSDFELQDGKLIDRDRPDEDVDFSKPSGDLPQAPDLKSYVPEGEQDLQGSEGAFGRLSNIIEQGKAAAAEPVYLKGQGGKLIGQKGEQIDDPNAPKPPAEVPDDTPSVSELGQRLQNLKESSLESDFPSPPAVDPRGPAPPAPGQEGGGYYNEPAYTRPGTSYRVQGKPTEPAPETAPQSSTQATRAVSRPAQSDPLDATKPQAVEPATVEPVPKTSNIEPSEQSPEFKPQSGYEAPEESVTPPRSGELSNLGAEADEGVSDVVKTATAIAPEETTGISLAEAASAAIPGLGELALIGGGIAGLVSAAKGIKNEMMEKSQIASHLGATPSLAMDAAPTFDSSFGR